MCKVAQYIISVHPYIGYKPTPILSASLGVKLPAIKVWEYSMGDWKPLLRHFDRNLNLFSPPCFPIVFTCHGRNTWKNLSFPVRTKSLYFILFCIAFWQLIITQYRIHQTKYPLWRTLWRFTKCNSLSYQVHLSVAQILTVVLLLLCFTCI